MPKVLLKSRGGLRYEGVRYQQGDALEVSDSFLARHSSRFEVIPPERKKKQRKKAPITEAVAYETPSEVISDGDNAGDNSGL